jgi:hypothetical protein
VIKLIGVFPTDGPLPHTRTRATLRLPPEPPVPRAAPATGVGLDNRPIAKSPALSLHSRTREGRQTSSDKILFSKMRHCPRLTPGRRRRRPGASSSYSGTTRASYGPLIARRAPALCYGEA